MSASYPPPYPTEPTEMPLFPSSPGHEPSKMKEAQQLGILDDAINKEFQQLELEESSRSLPYPLTPPLPPDPRKNRTFVQGQTLIDDSIWPYRLLHVPSMTSHIRQGLNIYNGMEAPDYNVISYTWGFYQDRTNTISPILIHGVDWPIPSIQPEHFTVDEFQLAINNAAKGYLCPCEWLWVDIACIPQEHAGETEEAKFLRGHEIGSQVGIFNRAKEAFAWLGGLRTSLFCGSAPTSRRYEPDVEEIPFSKDDIRVHIEDLYHQLNICLEYTRDKEEHLRTAVKLFENIELLVGQYEKRLDKFLSHPWFKSLWTLQEMVLREEAFVLCNDGLLDRYFSHWANGMTTPWRIGNLSSDIVLIRNMMRPESIKALDYVEAKIASQTMDNDQGGNAKYLVRSKNILGRLEEIINLMVLKGLDGLNLRIPHAIYSAASRRRCSKLKDRIYGIVQIYGISCNPYPPGNSEISKLHTLEDEFGAKLVAKAPILSQAFIHGSWEKRPRRSWLITQQCKVDDAFWRMFSSDYEVHSLFKSLEVMHQQDPDKSHLVALGFVGTAWYLRYLMESSPFPSVNLFNWYKPSISASYNFSRYTGLMLDYYVSYKVLGRVVDYFGSFNEMADAFNSLHLYYYHKMKDNCNCIPAECLCYELRVALLGSSLDDSFTSMSCIGIVLAPCLSPAGNGFQNSWERIGILRWTERVTGVGESPLYQIEFPTSHDFSCMIY